MIIPWVYFLQEDEQLLVASFTRRWTVNGPGEFISRPLYRVKRRKGLTLSPTEYARIRDTVSGELRNETGPKLYFLTATEEVVWQTSVIPLKKNQYIKLIDNETGVIRVERGESAVYLAPTEKVLTEPESGVNVDEHIAVLVRDIANGQLELITEPQVFIPTMNQEIIQKRGRILLEDHETVVIKDREGKYLFKRGSDEERAFFLDPYSKLVTFYWAAGIHKDARTLEVTHIDTRPKFMWYEFEARTQDNVELVIGITFFWQIVDVEAMIQTTDDTPGDICSHARSTIIQAVSQVALEQFLAEFNTIVRRAVLDSDDEFYPERGSVLHAVEVRSITCKDPDTQRILQEIIQETTNRLNRLQKQESENEVSIKRMQGEIEAENMRGQLLATRREHSRTEALTVGEAEAERVRSFLDGLGDAVPIAEKIRIFNTLRKQDILEKLGEGTAQLYFTPSDVDLSIETK